MLAPETTGVCRLQLIAAVKARLVYQGEAWGFAPLSPLARPSPCAVLPCAASAHRAARSAGFAAALGA